MGLLSRMFNLSKKNNTVNTKQEGDSTQPDSENEKEFLKKVNILADLNTEELDLVWSIVKKIEVTENTVILREGELGDNMYFFARGAANVTKNLTLKLGHSSFGNVEKSMNKLDSAFVSFFGDMAMFEDEPRSASITAATDCTLYEVKREDFIQLCDKYPLLGVKILRKSLSGSARIAEIIRMCSSFPLL